MQRDFEGCVRGVVPAVALASTCRSPRSTTRDLAPDGQARGQQLRLLPARSGDRETQGRLRDEMAERIVAKIAAAAPNFPDLIERQFNYPAYTYELMFGCTGGDFTHGLLQPEFMGPFRPGPRGLARQPGARRGPLPLRRRVPRRPRRHLHPRLQLRLRRAGRG